MASDRYLARFGGDEFAVLQTDVGDATAAGALAAKIGEIARRALPHRGHEVRVTASIGISYLRAELAGPEAV